MELDSVLKKLRKLQNLYEGAKKINSEGEEKYVYCCKEVMGECR